MKALKDFIIPFSGLKQGTHEFDFEVNKEFFACFENSEITDGKVDVLLTMEKRSVLLQMDLFAEGTVQVQCDRCGEDFSMEITGEHEFIAKLGNEEDNSDNEVVYLPVNEHEIDISQQVYEMISLAVPIQRVHPKGQCNKEALKNIKVFAPEKSTKKTEIDPRWEALKQLKLKK